MRLIEHAEAVAAEFEVSESDINHGVETFMQAMESGLQRPGHSLSQIPSFITAVPNGSEKGLYLAVDIGGTNVRVCSVQLNGDNTFSMNQTKVSIPPDLMITDTAAKLFSFLALQVEAFLKTYHHSLLQLHSRRVEKDGADIRAKDATFFQLGFTFSFPVNQIAINRGTLARWTKGFDIPDAVGKDVCEMLQDALDALHLPVRVAALVNDTVGTLMARSYTSPNKTGTLLGAIFGTGTNGAYVERLERIGKLIDQDQAVFDTTTGKMIVNTEWGAFDNEMSILPNTNYDQALDTESVNPGLQMFEKRVSGMFLGEILRRAMVDLMTRSGLFSAWSDNLRSSNPEAWSSAPINKRWGVDTAFLSNVERNETGELHAVHDAIGHDLGIFNASDNDALAVKLLVHAIGRRSARLSAIPIAAVVIATRSLGSAPDNIVDIGVDGSLVEFYPGFEGHVRSALREVREIGTSGEEQIKIGIAKDGSGVGAALVARMACHLGSTAHRSIT